MFYDKMPILITILYKKKVARFGKLTLIDYFSNGERIKDGK